MYKHSTYEVGKLNSDKVIFSWILDLLDIFFMLVDHVRFPIPIMMTSQPEFRTICTIMPIIGQKIKKLIAWSKEGLYSWL